MMREPSANHAPTHAATDQARDFYTKPMGASLKAIRSAPTQARSARKHGHLQVTEGHSEVTISIGLPDITALQPRPRS